MHGDLYLALPLKSRNDWTVFRSSRLAYWHKMIWYDNNIVTLAHYFAQKRPKLLLKNLLDERSHRQQTDY
jgi:hypothetical protein